MIKPFGLLIILFLITWANVKAQDTLSQNKDFKPSGKITGYFFGDYAYKLHADEQQRGNLQYSKLPDNYNSFNIRRIYLGYDYRFSPKVSSQLTLAHESLFESDPRQTNVLTDNNRAVYIKYANIRLRDIIPRTDIVFGQQATPTFALLSEKLWGYRSIEKTMTDMRGMSGSSDLGIGIFGKIGKGEKTGYDVMVGNNNGSKPDNNQFKKLYTSFYTYLFDKKLVLQVNYEYNQMTAYAGARGHKSLYNIFAGYKTTGITIGIEAFEQLQTGNTLYTPKAEPPDTLYGNAKPAGISIFYTQVLKPGKLNLFARVDGYNPDVKYNAANIYQKDYASNKEIFATVGLDFIPYKNVHIMPNLWYDSYHNKLQGMPGDKRNDYDLAGRITVYFIFNQ